jgi:hypothetical protein
LEAWQTEWNKLKKKKVSGTEDKVEALDQTEKEQEKKSPESMNGTCKTSETP